MGLVESQHHFASYCIMCRGSEARFADGPGLAILRLNWQSDRHVSETVHGESSIHSNHLWRWCEDYPSANQA